MLGLGLELLVQVVQDLWSQLLLLRTFVNDVWEGHGTSFSIFDFQFFLDLLFDQSFAVDYLGVDLVSFRLRVSFPSDDKDPVFRRMVSFICSYPRRRRLRSRYHLRLDASLRVYLSVRILPLMVLCICRLHVALSESGQMWLLLSLF